MEEEKGILQTLKEGLSRDIDRGSLVALIEKDKEGVPAAAWLVVSEGITKKYVGTSQYKKQLKVKVGKQSLVILSNNALILKPTRRKIGKIGFHIPELHHPAADSVCTPEEVYIGEYQIDQAFQKHFAQFGVYRRLIEVYP